jgi:SWI/SNF-related matrix-associated actin-dependent regulator of chromatin subfamily A member 5
VFPVDTDISFKKAFDLSKGSASTSFMDDARRLLELVMLRRMKNSPGVNLNLPPKEEVLLFVPLTPMQRFWYQRLLTKVDNGLLEDVFKGAKTKEEQAVKYEEDNDAQQLAVLQQAADAAEKAEHGDTADVWAESKAIMEKSLVDEAADTQGADYKKLLNLIMQLRKACSHPYLIKGAQPEPLILGEHIIKASGKFIVLEKLVRQLVLKERKKVIIFSGFTHTLDLCEDFLALQGANAQNAPFRFVRFDGQTQRAKRNLSIRMFNDPASDFRVMLISTRAGGLGINLTAATEVVFMDEDWNPQITLQAEARAHRIGQTKKVTVYKLCTQGTVEEQMMGRIRKKLYLSAKITESMRNLHGAGNADSKKRKRGPTRVDLDEDAPQLGTSELKTLLRRGAQTLSAPEVDVTEMLTWSWETTLEKCKDRPIDARVGEVKDDKDAMKTDEIDEAAWLNSIEKVETAVFEGKVHQRQLEKAAKENVELVRSDRRLGKNTTVMVDGFAISKESMGCADWEAVPTFAGKDPRLAEPKREKKAPIVNQEHCQVCWTDEGKLSCCAGCPRSYHLKCLDGDMKMKAKAKFGLFYCPQHECCRCEKKTTDAGGLIYRCRWCEKGYCDDCMDWDGPLKPQLIGERLPELEMLGYETKNGWYIDCPQCVSRWDEDKEDYERFQAEKKRIDKKYEKHILAIEKNQEIMGAQPAISAGSATPTTVSEALTPVETEMPAAKKAKLNLLNKAAHIVID